MQWKETESWTWKRRTTDEGIKRSEQINKQIKINICFTFVSSFFFFCWFILFVHFISIFIDCQPSISYSSLSMYGTYIVHTPIWDMHTAHIKDHMNMLGVLKICRGKNLFDHLRGIIFLNIFLLSKSTAFQSRFCTRVVVQNNFFFQCLVAFWG